MRGVRVWARLLGVPRAVVEDVQFGSEGEFVVAVRPVWRERDRCGICRRRSPGFDLGEGRRRWRTLDLGTTLAYVESESPRVRCRRHGVVVCAVPWARHGSRFTREFEDQVAWLAVNCSKTAVSQLMRIAWRTVGGICERVAAEAAEGRDLLAGLTRIGIDEISHRKGQRYLTVVVDHDTGGWCGPRLAVTARPSRRSSTGSAKNAANNWNWCRATWPPGSPLPVAERCPSAELCLDPFHVVQLATKALDEIRRDVWNQARREGLTALAGELKDARFALWKNPENLTARQELKLARIEHANRPLFRAYLLKEQLRQIYRIPAAQAAQLLERWLVWARRCRLRPFVKLAKTITDQKPGILAAINNGLSNARVEAINTQIRLITRRAFGFHTPEALIALAMLSLGGLCPPLPR